MLILLRMVDQIRSSAKTDATISNNEWVGGCGPFADLLIYYVPNCSFSQIHSSMCFLGACNLRVRSGVIQNNIRP